LSSLLRVLFLCRYPFECCAVATSHTATVPPCCRAAFAIRGATVTRVQTCALPISSRWAGKPSCTWMWHRTHGVASDGEGGSERRSEEHRVGKECRSRWAP